ncbi:MAG: beta-galactosidase, partial [Clostridia bacterium]|nr:beta-galactosidase [Clostridia bacterium]
MIIYRTEHPKPQFERTTWRTLNGPWQFEIDQSASGQARKLYLPEAELKDEIQVPFCPESRLSGIGYTDFINAVWYKRNFELTAEELAGRVILHFGAVDYEATVYVNGKEVGKHRGGYVSFSFDITEYATVGTNVVTLYAEDDSRDRLIPSGKQSFKYESFKCYYTRTTGIWQSVWLEFVPKAYIQKIKLYPSVQDQSLTILATLQGEGTLTATAFFEGKEMGCTEIQARGGVVTLNVLLEEKHLWEVGKGGLYDLELSFGEDRVKSYFGLRT